jgi:hypothetical protein
VALDVADLVEAPDGLRVLIRRRARRIRKGRAGSRDPANAAGRFEPIR